MRIANQGRPRAGWRQLIPGEEHVSELDTAAPQETKAWTLLGPPHPSTASALTGALERAVLGSGAPLDAPNKALSSTPKETKGMNAPGTAAPQCGIRADKSTEESRSGERRTQERTQQDAKEQRGWYSRGYLPHFDSPHVIQHITYRLGDSLPYTVLEKMQAEAATIRDDRERKTELRRRIEAYLDAGHGSCVLQEPEVAACVVDIWHRFDGERYHLLEWVVMPNHCRVLIEPSENVRLGKIVLSWKNYTARFINKYKSRTGVRRSQGTGEQRGQVWQREYWDRFIRNERHFWAVQSYIVMNPVKAGLVAQPGDWPWGSARFREGNAENGSAAS